MINVNYMKKYAASCLVTVMLIVLIVLLEAFFKRQTEEVKSSTLMPEIPVFVQINATDKELYQELISLYSMFDQEPKEEEVEESGLAKEIMSEQQQLMQNGNLLQLYIGESKYLLLGIYSIASKNVALLRKVNLKTQDVELVEVTTSSLLKNWQVNRISENKVEFRHEKQQVTLQIFSITKPN